ncbi:MAG TPA: hypothetical protein VFU19_13465 [Iamia sp.]|nr:hypothetical protein [Iamia sp.]
MDDRTSAPRLRPHTPLLGALAAFGPDLDPTSPERALARRSPKVAAILTPGQPADTPTLAELLDQLAGVDLELATALRIITADLLDALRTGDEIGERRARAALAAIDVGPPDAPKDAPQPIEQVAL